MRLRIMLAVAAAASLTFAATEYHRSCERRLYPYTGDQKMSSVREVVRLFDEPESRNVIPARRALDICGSSARRQITQSRLTVVMQLRWQRRCWFRVREEMFVITAVGSDQIVASCSYYNFH